MVREILVTGGSGQVGAELLHLAWPDGLRLVAPTRAELDLADVRATQAYLAGKSWAGVINCAAFTAVDRAEAEAVAAWQLNALLPSALAAATGPAGIPLVHVSTDYVFDGTKPTAYETDDTPNPISVYGASKLGGELAVRASNPRHAIMRTSWVFSSRGSNFVRTMLRLGRERDCLRVVDDQFGRPTGAADLAAAIRAAMLRLIGGDAAVSGTFHFANEGATTWHGFAEAIFRRAAAAGQPAPRLEAIPTADYPTPARRPRSSVLSTTSFANAFGLTPRPWDEALADCMAALMPA